MLSKNKKMNVQESIIDENIMLDEKMARELTDEICEVIKPDISTLNIAGITDQALKLSNNEQFIKTLEMIRSDPSIPIEEKLRLMNEEEERQQKRIEMASEQAVELQASQVEAYWNSIKPYVLVGISASAVIILSRTPAGRDFLTKILANIVKELPHKVIHA